MGYLVSLSTAFKLSKDFRDQSQKVIFTHGAFDLFHAGHSSFLKQSKKEGEILIVGIEPDENVRRYKNFMRPILNTTLRAEIVASHSAVDFVFVNETPEILDYYQYKKLYRHIKPSLVTIGKRFLDKQLPEKQFKSVSVQEIDSEVTTTTKIISSILNRYH